MSPKPERSTPTRGDMSSGIHSFMAMVAKEAEEYAAAHASPMLLNIGPNLYSWQVGVAK